MSLESLPNELLSEITSNLSLNDVSRLSRTSRRLRQDVTDELSGPYQR